MQRPRKLLLAVLEKNSEQADKATDEQKDKKTEQMDKWTEDIHWTSLCGSKNLK